MDGLQLNIRLQTDLIVWSSGLTTPEIKKAINRAINYATARAKTRMKRAVTSEYNLRASQVADSSIVRRPSTTATLTGLVYGSSSPESLGHFGPTEYKRSSAGSIKTSRGAHYKSQKLKSNTSKSGIYFEIVKGKKEHIQSAWLWFSGSTPIVMARGQYKTGSGGSFNKTSSFSFMKPRYPITKLNTKSVYWGVLHPKTVIKWEPETEQDYLRELQRQVGVILQMR